jgi:hypothetical protein
MADAALTMTFSEAAQTAIAMGSESLTEDQLSKVMDAFGDGSTQGPRVLLMRRLVFNRLVSDGKIAKGTKIEAVDWASLIDALMQLLPVLIPLICPSKP